MASIALFVWPFISIALFGWLGRERGLIWSVVVGYLFLPERYTHPLPGLPDYEKFLAISLGLVLGALLFGSKSSFGFKLAPTPPRNMGAEIASAWAKILDLETVPRDVTFRALGGSSSKARAAVRAMVDLGLTMSKARSIYDGATIADLTRVGPEEGPSKIGDRSIGTMYYILFGLLMVGVFLTVQTNGETLFNGNVVRPGLTIRDLVSSVADPLIAMVPFFVALRFLRSRSHLEEVVKVIAISGAFYACLAAFEARMSPQLNIWVYGYFPHAWIQHLRDGFRPVVFLRHGLMLGFFLLTASFAAFALYRQLQDPRRYLYLGAGIWILLVLFFSRNLGAAMLAAMFLPILLFAPKFIQLRVAVFCGALFLAYPAIWQSQILPVDRFLELVTSISEDRAQSLQTRLDNEALILERSLEKPFFGWGGWGRWRVFDETGEDLTISDGIWVITLGESGWVGYLCFFGMIALPLFYLSRAFRVKGGSQVVIGMALIMSANLIYMIPNSALTPIAWLLVGAIAGYARWYVIEVDAVDHETEAPERKFSPYTRFTTDHTRSAPNALDRGGAAILKGRQR